MNHVTFSHRLNIFQTNPEQETKPLTLHWHQIKLTEHTHALQRIMEKSIPWFLLTNSHDKLILWCHVYPVIHFKCGCGITEKCLQLLKTLHFWVFRKLTAKQLAGQSAAALVGQTTLFWFHCHSCYTRRSFMFCFRNRRIVIDAAECESNEWINKEVADWRG